MTIIVHKTSFTNVALPEFCPHLPTYSMNIIHVLAIWRGLKFDVPCSGAITTMHGYLICRVIGCLEIDFVLSWYFLVGANLQRSPQLHHFLHFHQNCESLKNTVLHLILCQIKTDKATNRACARFVENLMLMMKRQKKSYTIRQRARTELS